MTLVSAKIGSDVTMITSLFQNYFSKPFPKQNALFGAPVYPVSEFDKKPLLFRAISFN